MAEAKTTFSKINDILTLLVLAAGLGFTAYQALEIKQSIDVTNANTNFTTWNSVAQQWLDLDGLFVEHPELRKYIFGGEAPPPTDAPEYQRVLAVANKTLDLIDNAATIERVVKASKDKSTSFQNIINQNGWDRYFTGLFATSPTICELIFKHPDFYDKATVALASGNDGCRKKTTHE